ncbi:hypothetical protein HATV-3_gp80 [Haloarcula tailed virus 3]|uniref:Uncharacterized protein n=1 Tax=Haloarcula tailed virus 3 TaxID=2877990 RepID=A0AAE8XZ91_9CAUD|nr:hypothetical protein M1M35_gp80 [Haloarcula tailed virus 3]UBF23430.1 hypothetical protein HATV-3_gp80 [Haloarcula tailed virus 3]
MTSTQSCPCGMDYYGEMVSVESRLRPRNRSEICVDCRFSWGVKE